MSDFTASIEQINDYKESRVHKQCNKGKCLKYFQQTSYDDLMHLIQLSKN